MEHEKEIMLPLNDVDFDDEPYRYSTSDDEPHSGKLGTRNGFRWGHIFCLLFLFTVSIAFFATWTGTMIFAWQVANDIGMPSALKVGTDESSAASDTTGNNWDHIRLRFSVAYNSSYCNGIKDPYGARERGCVLDPIHGGWIHNSCSDAGLLAEFIQIRDFGWHLDQEYTQPVAQERVWRGEDGVKAYFAKDDFHFRHCQYTLKLLAKTWSSEWQGMGYGFLLLDETHMAHCIDRLVNFNTPEIRESNAEEVHIGASAPCYHRV